MKFKSIELFAGGGGLALGLESAGFEHIGLIEFDKYAAETLKQNRKNWNVLNKDIKDITSLNLEKLFNIKKRNLDLLSGGAPCQSFSYAGKRLGLEDTRGTLFYHYAIFLKKLQPKMFLFENVKGLYSLDKGKAFETIVNVFKNEGYHIEHKILNAWDYNVAQKRERLIIIGIRNDLYHNGYKFFFPKKNHQKLFLKDILINVPHSDGSKYSREKEKIFSLVPPGGYWKDINQNIAKKYMKTCWDMKGGRTGILRRLSLEEPSLTILTTPQMKQTDRCHPFEVRPFNIRESARIQSFPDNWTFYGSISQQYKQIGNAVPCNLAKAIGIEIFKTLKGEYNQMSNPDYDLHFIKQEDFEHHVKTTIESYINSMKSMNLNQFNRNIIDPIKFLFDKKIYSKSDEEVISSEIQRQIDKTNSNSIGYFHQNIFKYINNCEVPNKGWDIIVTANNSKTLYIELKNKHNTMNSSSSAKTYMRMQNHLLNAVDKKNSTCALVEVIAKKSQDTCWKPCIDGMKQISNENLRIISIDKLYERITGEALAFNKLCIQLPKTIDKIVKNFNLTIAENHIYNELTTLSPDIQTALYKLAFKTYAGFN